MSFWKHFYHPHAAMVLLRVTLAVLMLFHGWAKITNGVGGIESMLIKAGLPGFLAYAVFLGEVVAPLFLLVGLYVVLVALVVAMNMLVALVLVHTNRLLAAEQIGRLGAGVAGFFLVTALVVAMGTARANSPCSLCAPGACMPEEMEHEKVRNPRLFSWAQGLYNQVRPALGQSSAA